MDHYPHPLIAREGWPFLAISLGAALLVTGAAGLAWASPLWLVFVFCLQFFRDPARPVAGDARSVLSPADGRIVAIEPLRDPWLDREALKVSVFMNVFNVHSNRAPVDGRVLSVNYFPGRFVNADLDKASLENERNALVIDCSGQLVTTVQVAGLVARRVLCYVRPGDTLQRGQRFGFIRFGSRVDVYLPLHAKPAVSIGEKVRATSTVLALWPQA